MPRADVFSPEHDRLWRSRHLIDAIIDAAKRLAEPGAHVTLDEMMIRSKGAVEVAGFSDACVRSERRQQALQFLCMQLHVFACCVLLQAGLPSQCASQASLFQQD